MSVWFITGISRGLGRSLADAALRRGHTVVGTTRSGTADLEHDRLHVLPLELIDPSQVAPVVNRAHELAGGIDVVVNNAGFGLLGPVQDSTAEQTAEVFEVNFFAPLRIIQAAVPHLRTQGRGHLVNIASIAALDPHAGSGVYAAAKSALVAMSEALAEELRPLGIGVTAVEPGSFRTDFLTPASIRRTGDFVSPLDAMDGKQPGDPDRAAEVIIDAVEGGRPPRHLVLGADAIARTRENTRSLLADVDAWAAAAGNTSFG
ncbi:SDR family NAD(P)-dependent oxidoreductase [Pseudonocardiaceae bacterium YIM PH 21723]|nr:SDR family NAD(P)-dependent oxidoreductase [Pseudonocardiaceae bacterium YIM PH 21723]